MQKFTIEKLYPMDLKNGVADALNELLEPVRKHFRDDKKTKELLSTVGGYTKEA